MTIRLNCDLFDLGVQFPGNHRCASSSKLRLVRCMLGIRGSCRGVTSHQNGWSIRAWRNMFENARIISNCVHVLHPRELQIPRGLFGIEAASSRDLVRVTSVSSVPKNLGRRRCQFIHDLTLRKRSKSLFLMPVDIFQVVVSSWNHWASGLRLNCLSKVRSCNRQDLGIAALQHRYFVTPSCHHILHLEPGQLCCSSCAAAWIPTLLVNELQVR